MNGKWLVAMILVGLIAAEVQAAPPAKFQLQESLEIAEVPSGFPVHFCLLTAGNHQYVGYYDKHRQMTVAMRTLDSTEWQVQVLPSRIAWDSHNYITMAVDGDGQLHVSGNMHNVKLVYFRTEEPGNLATLTPTSMTGERENRVTYPKFLTNHRGELIFNYRDGGSGNGVRIYNRYDLATRTWSRLIDKPLLDGEGQRNAYPLGPIRGPMGQFHLVWVWRDTPDCATNHHLSYARSHDLVHWESVTGQPVELPMTIADKQLWVDPVPSGGGIINGCEKLFFDADHRPIITYHKSDARGNMQIYAARPRGSRWSRHLLTDWRTPIRFSGRGSMGFIGIRISELSRVAPGLLTLTYRHRDHGSGWLVIDEKTLRPLARKIDVVPEYPPELERVESDFEGMTVRRSSDSGRAEHEQVRYVLQWETLGANRDRPRQPPLPRPSVLKLHKLVASDDRPGGTVPGVIR